MNLHKLARPAINAVHPDRDISVRFFQGYTVDASGIQSAAYSEPVLFKAQVQPVRDSEPDLHRGVTEQTVMKHFWISGEVRPLSRFRRKGGDIIDTDGESYTTLAADGDWFTGAGWVHVRGVLRGTA